MISSDRELARNGLLSIPTMSIVTNVQDLFGSRGIYANPSLSGPQWERPVSMELIYPDGTRGTPDRRRTSSAGRKQHPQLEVHQGLDAPAVFSGDYGAKRFEFPIFPDSPVDSFDSIVLDAHLTWPTPIPITASALRSQFVRDIYVADMQRAAGSLARMAASCIST